MSWQMSTGKPGWLICVTICRLHPRCSSCCCVTQAANFESRIPVTFIDLTHQDILMMPWLPTDACSGRNDEAGLTGRTDMLSKIATAVQSAEEKTRFFRKFNHWIFAFQRYAPAAIAVEQWSQVGTLNRLETISDLAESPRW